MAKLGECAKNFTCSDDVGTCVSLVEMGTTSLHCINCIQKVSACIIDKCSGPCFKENSNHNQCEKCIKDVKCSLDECNSPNYLLHKRRVPGMPTRTFFECCISYKVWIRDTWLTGNANCLFTLINAF